MPLFGDEVVTVGIYYNCLRAAEIPGVEDVVGDGAPTLQHLTLVAVKPCCAVIKMVSLKF